MSEKRILSLEDLLCGGQTASQRQDHARTQVGLRASAVTKRCDPACRWGGIARPEGQGLGKSRLPVTGRWAVCPAARGRPGGQCLLACAALHSGT